MLFGRRKPGFVQIEEELSTVKSMAEESATKEKTDLLEYLVSLPDVEDEFAEESSEEQEKKEEMTEARKLAEYIRTRSAGAYLTGYSNLKKEIENVDQLLVEIQADDTCQDIAYKDGKKDRYFYSSLNMSDNYAMISSLIEDKDLSATIVEMVRFNCSTYPTPLSYFERHPYYATKPQIERAIDQIYHVEEYSDISRFTNNRSKDYLFSTKYMSLRYATALAKEEDFMD
ncbi:hypothetical protein [Clostridium sp. Marseille-P299]|uniref:hypothetical protein n=1 Tax=Clostridium sp. Marseille-P299 TaxID=1805477 RepID=UPI00082EF44F|nr:hypothetical protein [Clostridium sp. Marseille-P299]